MEFSRFQEQILEIWDAHCSSNEQLYIMFDNSFFDKQNSHLHDDKWVLGGI